MTAASFTELAAVPEPPLDDLALALAAEFRAVDRVAALAALDALGRELAGTPGARQPDPAAQARACAELLGRRHGFAGDREDYDHPDNSMLDVVLERRRGLPILLSVLYIEVARRASIPLVGVGLPGHFVVAHRGAEPPLVLDPFEGGAAVAGEFPEPMLQPWSTVQIVMRMLNNLVSAYGRRTDFDGALRAARMRVVLPAPEAERRIVQAELRALQARLN
ncbi:MAG TPA: transglutaminase-like domain-containing protein [Solirubrobacteraceae bacterium]|nr:transglutaminase-like domain-containing protein [Solirubrobacteraceae bacterium]